MASVTTASILEKVVDIRKENGLLYCIGNALPNKVSRERCHAVFVALASVSAMARRASEVQPGL